MEYLQTLLDNSSVPAATAFLLGLLTAISPCPLATNIAAIGYLSKEITDRRRIFIDGLLSIMFTGVVSRPLIDKYKVSREKLAYICDATSAPVNAIIPLNSWGAMLMGLIAAEITAGFVSGDPMTLLIESLPFQFYSILSLVFVLFYILTGKDWGPMKRAEQRVQTTGALYDEGVTPLLNDRDGIERLVPTGKGNKWNMILPLIVLIGGTFIGLFVTGGGNIIDGSGTTAILYSVIVTLLFMAVLYTRQKIMTGKQFSDYLLKGVSMDGLAEAIMTVYQGQAMINPDIATKVLRFFSQMASDQSPIHIEDRQVEELTRNEWKIIDEVAKGHSNKEISEILSLSEGTVRNYISTILDKLGLRDRTQLASWAIQSHQKF